MTTVEAIQQVLGTEVSFRNDRRLLAAMRSSRLPAIKALSDFDFSFPPSLRREQMESLHVLGFVERKESGIFLDPPGVGKSHLALSLAVATAQSGRRIYYGTLAERSGTGFSLTRGWPRRCRPTACRMRFHSDGRAGTAGRFPNRRDSYRSSG